MRLHLRDHSDRRERGALLMLTAILLPVLILMTSFAVDLGIQRASRRTMQARADVIALDMVRIINGRTANALRSDPATETAIQASATRNNIARAKIISVDWGVVDATNHFFSGTTNPASAVKVTTSETTQRIFRTGTGSTTRSAVATTGSPWAAFTIGSFAARISTSGSSVLALASQLTGLNANTTLVGYNGLASSRIGIGPLLAELGVGSADNVATTNVSMASFMAASARVLQRSNASTDLANAALLNGMVAAGLPSKSFNLGQLLDVTPGGGGAALDSSVNALDLVTAGAQLANGVNGFELNNLGLNLNNLGGSGISLASVQADLDVIQPPVLISGPVGKTGRTDQVKTHVDATLLGGSLGGLANAGIHIDLGTATGTGTIAAINCASNPQTFDVSAQAALLQTTIAITLTLLGIPVTITLQKAPGTKTGSQTFTRVDDPLNPDPAVFTPDPREIGNGQIGLAGITPTVTFGGPLGLLGPTINALLAPLLTIVTGTLLPVLDTSLLGPLTNQLGLNVGGADLRPVDEVCTNGVVLVG